MKVLFISQWYPHRYDAMEGLFVRKHAEAVSLYADVCVLFVYDDEKIKKTEIIKNQYNSVTEYFVYYSINKKNPFYKIIKVFKCLNAYRKGFKLLKKEGFKPDIVHANVLTRTSFIAYLYKMFTKTPYIITEHWSRLLKSQSNFKGFFRNFLAKRIVKNAEYILPVSEELLNGINYHNLLLTKSEVVENVVDNCFFEKQNKRQNNPKKLMNVSCFDEKAKNLKGLLRTIKKVSEIRDDFKFTFVGTGKDFDEVVTFYKKLNIKDGIVSFTGEISEKKVADLMSQHDAVVQFSNYETAGVVVQEALVVGCPVISTKVGIATKYINKKNGILVDIADEKQLFEAINLILDNSEKINRNEIRQIGQKFSYDKIGQKLFNIYNKSL